MGEKKKSNIEEKRGVKLVKIYWSVALDLVRSKGDEELEVF